MVTDLRRAMRPTAKVEPPTLGLKFLAPMVTFLFLCVTVPARAYTSPLDTIPGFWSFAARNDAITMVVFPAWWPTLGPPDRYTFEVQKSRHRYAVPLYLVIQPDRCMLSRFLPARLSKCPTPLATIDIPPAHTHRRNYHRRAVPWPSLKPSLSIQRTLLETSSSPLTHGMARYCTIECR